MTKLPQEVIRHNVRYTLVQRTDKVAIYSLAYPKLGTVVGYDVFKIRTCKDWYGFGTKFEGGESFPSPTNYGNIAWSFSSKEAATEKYNELVKEEK